MDGNSKCSGHREFAEHRYQSDFWRGTILSVEEVKVKPDKSQRKFAAGSFPPRPPQKHFTVTPELEAWLLEAEDKPTTPLTSNDFAAIRERVRAKTH